MFRILARFVYRSPWMCISLWVGLAVLTGLLAPTAEELQLSEPASLLPDQAPSNTAMRVYAEAFPEQTARSRIVLVFERTSGLTAKDRQYLVSLSRELESEGRTGRETWRVWSASIRPELGIRLNSSDGQATMIVIGLDVNFVTQRAAAIVDQVEAQARSELPPGLTLETTGSAAIGREHNTQAGAALARTTRVTILAVLIILAFVYRSPLGALVPLASIGLSVFIAFRVLDFLALAGWSISGAERTFTVVLLFGAGTNYTLFWISRYREALSRGIDGAAATMEAMTRVGPTILASAGTTIFGLMMLMSADMIIIHNSGKVLGLVLCVALLSAITLAPAMITVMGRAFFWPGNPADHLSVGQRYVWPRLAKDLVRRPYGVFFCGLLVVSLPAVASFWTPLRYDTLGVVPQDTTAERGLAMLNAHFWEEEIFSTRLLIESSDFESDRQRLKVLSDDLAARLTEVEDVSDVWHMGAPAGRRRGSGLASLLTSPLLSEQVTKYYYAQRQNVLQMEVMQRHPPWSPEAVAVLARLQQTTHEWASQNLKSGYNLYALGQTPYIQDVKNIADGDLSRVVWLVTGVIWIIVLAVIRRVYLTIFMLAATLLSFAAAFGLTGWIFVDLLGGGGVDYKVQILLFVIIVAVGQDYNIFLVQRMLEELKSFELDEAITRSVILTGPIISSCGLIMAATLGSLATTRVALTRQMGFACAAGILIDTFLVRPLLIPSFYLILERLGSRRHGPAKENSEPKVPARPE